ncbi:MAG TPA: hypothetical protein VNN79_17120 [Actinomycetota bacterium]|nr:hypothetical protein [Actinomycetota bacterium]
MSIRRMRPSASMVVSIAALVISMSGVGYAVSQIGTADIQNGAVTTPKLHNGAVTKAKLHGNAVNGSKVVDNSITGNDVNESTLGNVPTADNALSLQGSEPSDFERAGTILFGSGPINAGTPRPLLSSPVSGGVGVSVATDGDADSDDQLLITNNNGSGNLLGVFTTSGSPGTQFTLAAGGATVIGPAITANNTFLETMITFAGSPDRSILVRCWFKTQAGIPTAFCWGTQAT